MATRCHFPEMCSRLAFPETARCRWRNGTAYGRLIDLPLAVEIVHEALALYPEDVFAVGASRDELVSQMVLREAGRIVEQVIAAAERHNEPGRFTTLIGYEWTSTPDEINLHRNVIFRGSAVPEMPFSRLDSDKPEDLWRFLDEQRAKGIDAMAIPHNSPSPSLDQPALRVVRMSGAALTEGIAPVAIDGVSVPVFDPNKTVADCFKYRNKIGRDVAVEALRDAISQRKATVRELDHFAHICRVARTMRPYLELYL